MLFYYMYNWKLSSLISSIHTYIYVYICIYHTIFYFCFQYAYLTKLLCSQIFDDDSKNNVYIYNEINYRNYKKPNLFLSISIFLFFFFKNSFIKMLACLLVKISFRIFSQIRMLILHGTSTYSNYISVLKTTKSREKLQNHDMEFNGR